MNAPVDEFLALAYWKERKLPVIIVRLFNTVGPRQSGQYGMVVPNFVRQALAGEPITVFGDGTQDVGIIVQGGMYNGVLRALQGVGLGLVPLAMATARDELPTERVAPMIALLSVCLF